ncbi:MAG: hypothetical protein L0Z55_04490 [Planctomycetes bacterium]|nr:hypothetical protein [Planctomycetota bacterium]
MLRRDGQGTDGMKPAAERRAAWIAILAFVLAGAAGVARAAAGDEPKVLQTVGVVGDVSDTGFKWKTKSGSWNVSYASTCAISRYGIATVADLAQGATVHVLGRPIESQPSSGGGKLPPEITQVQVVVVGQGFDPPPVPQKLRDNKLQWVSGSIHLRPKEKQVLVDRAVLQYGPTKQTIVIEKAEKSAIAKGVLLFAMGLPAGEKKDKELTISRASVLHAEIKPELHAYLFPQ